jgi:major membrane immunogen (membrane-anchored lipoprotein)
VKKILACIAVIVTISSLTLSSCKNSAADAPNRDASAYSGAAYTDGIYVGKSSGDDRDAYGEVTIEIEGGAIKNCTFVTWQKDGSIKDEEYGKINGEISNQDYYDKAQLAVDAMSKYAQQLVEAQQLEGVDAISGATIAFNQFQEATMNALDEAKN